MDPALKAALERLDAAATRLEVALAPRLVQLAADGGTRADLARGLDTVIETLERVLEATPAETDSNQASAATATGEQGTGDRQEAAQPLGEPPSGEIPATDSDDRAT